MSLPDLGGHHPSVEGLTRTKNGRVNSVIDVGLPSPALGHLQP